MSNFSNVIFFFFFFFLDLGLSRLTSLQFIQYHVAGLVMLFISGSSFSSLNNMSYVNTTVYHYYLMARK
jgi:hypothetical protein